MNDILKLMGCVKGTMKDYEDAMGLGRRAGVVSRLEEDASTVTSVLGSNQEGGRPLTPYQGKDSDAEVVFNFEDRDDAYVLYDFVIEAGLLEPGEVVLREIEGTSSVAFMPSVVVGKPEVIQAAMMAYEEQLAFESEEDEEAFESFVGSLTDLLTEAPTKTSGAPKRKKGMGNPFHDKNTGKFSGVKNHASKKGGSWAIGKTKLKFTGKGKTKEGGLLGKYGSTKHPCGRAARAKGKDVRCWDGNKGAGFRVAKALGKKRRAEDLEIADMMMLMEMRAKYRS